ncbi:MSP domain protein [Teladorsagia circumcincta]|uniref:Major sperm protein n=1 Tax=Teladorsagia circumcincta TaxID=45464 RepID=A0A2G9U693_TELCI|nr:MSP domain protein [Teladorsagia circumcincta]
MSSAASRKDRLKGRVAGPTMSGFAACMSERSVPFSVFNAPFDFEHVTYHMTIMNNTIHPLAFAIKGNCIPRVLAYPPYGVLRSKEKIQVAITMNKFDHEHFGDRDRIVYEWVLLRRFEDQFRPEMLKKFDHEHFGDRDRIVYEWVLLRRFEDQFRPEMLKACKIYESVRRT